jgi:hypothetical protein
MRYQGLRKYSSAYRFLQLEQDTAFQSAVNEARQGLQKPCKRQENNYGLAEWAVHSFQKAEQTNLKACVKINYAGNFSL